MEIFSVIWGMSLITSTILMSIKEYKDYKRRTNPPIMPAFQEQLSTLYKGDSSDKTKAINEFKKFCSKAYRKGNIPRLTLWLPVDNSKYAEWYLCPISIPKEKLETACRAIENNSWEIIIGNIKFEDNNYDNISSIIKDKPWAWHCEGNSFDIDYNPNTLQDDQEIQRECMIVRE